MKIVRIVRWFSTPSMASNKRALIIIIATTTLLFGMPLFLNSYSFAFADTTPPTLKYLEFYPNSVDVTHSSQTIIVKMRLTDDMSNVTQPVQFGVTAPNGYATNTSCNVAIPSKDVVCAGAFTFYKGAYAGDWDVSIRAWDSAGNVLEMDETDLAAAGFPNTIHVTSPDTSSDTTPPKLEFLTFFPRSVNITLLPQAIFLKMRLTDDSYVKQPVAFGVTAPNGYATNTSCNVIVNDSDVTCTGVLILDPIQNPNLPGGDWKVSVWAEDTAGNQLLMDADDLEAAGFPNTIHVTKTF